VEKLAERKRVGVEKLAEKLAKKLAEKTRVE